MSLVKPVAGPASAAAACIARTAGSLLPKPLIPLDSREQAYCIFARSPLSLSARLPAHSSNCCDLVHDSGLQGWPHWIQVGCVAVASDRERELEVLVLLVHILLSAPSIPMAPAPTHARLAPSKMRSCHRLGLHLLALQSDSQSVSPSIRSDKFVLAQAHRSARGRLPVYTCPCWE
eukprot:scaffold194453_cov28-Tisochrysis_lutea.AAC.1